MAIYLQTNQPVTVATAATYAPQLQDTGKIFLLAAQGAGMIITLPAAATVGTHYRFIMTALAGGIITIGTAAGAAGLGGGVVNCNGAAAVTIPIVAGSVTVNFTAAATFGDHIDVYALSATRWSVSGISQVNAGLSVT